RHYSTTLGAIRGERRAYRQRQTTEHVHELAPDEQDTTLVVARWEFTGLGYLTTGDTTLARSAATRAREQRQAARDAA
ncbi:MAG: replication initiator, partial [Pseudonocardiaceae bacterium]